MEALALVLPNSNNCDVDDGDCFECSDAYGNLADDSSSTDIDAISDDVADGDETCDGDDSNAPCGVIASLHTVSLN